MVSDLKKDYICSFLSQIPNLLKNFLKSKITNAYLRFHDYLYIESQQTKILKRTSNTKDNEMITILLMGMAALTVDCYNRITTAVTI